MKGGLRDRWQQCKREALKRGHLGAAKARSVFCQPNQPAEWQPVQYEAVKGLSKAVREGGIHSTFAVSLLEVMAEPYPLTPRDYWKSLLCVVRTPTQCMVWLSDFCELCVVASIGKLNRGIAVNCEPLAGENNCADRSCDSTFSYLCSYTPPLPCRNSQAKKRRIENV